MKKAGFMTKVLALTLAGAMLLSGCGKQGNVESTDNMERTMASEQEYSAEASTQSEEKVDASKESEVQASSQEESVSEEASKAPDAGNEEPDVSDVTDWAAHYKEYLKNYSMDGKKVSFRYDGMMEGMKLAFDMEFGGSKSDMYISYSVDTQDGGKAKLDIYMLEDGKAYLGLTMAGETTRVKASGMKQSDMGSVNLADDMIDVEQLDRFEYVGEETKNGVLYDVLKFRDEAQADSDVEAFYYMNRATQELELITAKSGDLFAMDGVISEMGKVTVPAEYDSAEEIDKDEFAKSMAMGLFGVLLSAVPMDGQE